MLRCVVVDDEPLAVKMLEDYISRTEFLTLAGSWSDPVAALPQIKELNPELVFLDIQMPDFDGLELATLLPEGCRVIFTTAFKQYAFDSYGVSALDFLLKPIRYHKFLEAANKAKQWFEMKEAAKGNLKPEGSIFIKSDGNLVKVEPSEIMYVEGMRDYVIVHTEGGKKLVTHLTMKAAEELLPMDTFMRVHRSFIINLARIDSVTMTGEVLIGDAVIHVSEAYSEAFSKYLSSRLLR